MAHAKSIQAAAEKTLCPAYMTLWQCGELSRRVELALKQLADCTLCPRNCRINRSEDNAKICKTGRHAVVSSHFAHFGEEACLRGKFGSGTIFFSWCNLRCVFCQNYDISWLGEGCTVEPQELAEMMLSLQGQSRDSSHLCFGWPSPAIDHEFVGVHCGFLPFIEFIPLFNAVLR